jgi:hypothetical protein
MSFVLSITIKSIMLSVFYAECHNQVHYAECCNAKSRYAGANPTKLFMAVIHKCS